MLSTTAAVAEHRCRRENYSSMLSVDTLSTTSTDSNDSTLSSDESTFKSRNFITSQSDNGHGSESEKSIIRRRSSSNEKEEATKSEDSGSYENLTDLNSKVSTSSSAATLFSVPAKTGSKHLYDTEYDSVDLDLSRIDIPKQSIKNPKNQANDIEPILSFSQLLKQLGPKKLAKNKESSAAEATDGELQSILAEDAQIIQRQKLFKRYYIGCKTNEEAKFAVQKPTSFRIYYKMSQNLYELIEDVEENGNDTYLRESLPLYIVYHRSDGIYDHYKVKCFEENDGAEIYQVQYGSSKAPKFRSVERLLKYYHNNIAIRSTRYGIEDEVDVFPYWKKK